MALLRDRYHMAKGEPLTLLAMEDLSTGYEGREAPGPAVLVIFPGEVLYLAILDLQPSSVSPASFASPSTRAGTNSSTPW